jgi:antitoxin CcdA
MARRSTNLSLDPALVDEAHALGLNLSATVNAMLAQAIAAERARSWRRENAAAIAATNALVADTGLWNDDLRLF